jgi:IS1 family transposase
LAVNRNKLQIAAFEVGDGSGATAEKLLKKLSLCTIKIICTDGNYAYNRPVAKRYK